MMKAARMRRLYLREAMIVLTGVKLAMGVLPAARLLAWVGRPQRRLRRFAGEEVAWVAWAIETLGTKSWMRTSCLSRSLAAQIMLRRRGIVSRVCLGVAGGAEALAAHAWVEVGGDVVVGGMEARLFTRLAAYGGERA
jgi:Transglutaminase-like superfamily